MAKTFREKIRDALAAKEQANADHERATQTLMQRSRDKQGAAVQQAFQLMEAALQDAVASLKERRFTAEFQPCTNPSTPETIPGHILTIRRPDVLTPPHTIILDYHGARFFLDNTRQAMHPIPTTQEAAQKLVSRILQTLELI